MDKIVDPLVVQYQGQRSSGRSNRERERQCQVRKQRQSEKVEHQDKRGRQSEAWVPRIRMMRPVRFGDHEFKGSPEQLNRFQMLKMSMHKPFLERPRATNRNDHAKVIERPITNKNAKGKDNQPRDQQKPRNRMAEIALSGFKERYPRPEPRHFVFWQLCFFFSVYLRSKIEEKEYRYSSNQPWPHKSLSKLCECARHAQLATFPIQNHSKFPNFVNSLNDCFQQIRLTNRQSIRNASTNQASLAGLRCAKSNLIAKLLHSI